MQFGVLGPLSVTSEDGAPLEIRRLKQRRLLSALLLRPNADVSVDQLAMDVWESSPPSSVRSNVKTYITGLRRLGVPIVTVPGGYRVELGPEKLDSLAFEELPARSPRALSLWRGSVLQGLPLSPEMDVIARRLQDGFARILEDFPVHESSPDLLDCLRQAITIEPLREGLYAQLMRALHYHGRTGEAIQAYREISARLADDLGAIPGFELQNLIGQIRAAGGITPCNRRPGAEAVVRRPVRSPRP